MPSSKLSRSPVSTFSLMGFNRSSVIVGSLISNPSKFSDAPKCRGRAPEQQKQHTNIAVHCEKRSVQLAQIIRFHQRMFIREQRRNDRDARPRRPGQSEAERQPGKQRDHPKVHSSGDPERIRNSELLGNRKQSRDRKSTRLNS